MCVLISLSLSVSVDEQSVTSSLPEELLVQPAVDKDRDIDVTPAKRRHLSWSARVFVLRVRRPSFLNFYIFSLCLFLLLSFSVACHSLVLGEGFSPSIKKDINTLRALISWVFVRLPSDDRVCWPLCKRHTNWQRERVSAAWVRVQ